MIDHTSQIFADYADDIMDQDEDIASYLMLCLKKLGSIVYFKT